MAGHDAGTRFGDLLRDHRRAAGLTQEGLAERAGISPRSISELERGGAHVPRRDTVALLARALDLAGPARHTFEAAVDERRAARSTSASADQTHTRPTAAERPKHNLPRALTSFIGREQELSELAPVLASAPLLTLVGAGGVGKTRLALELVRHHGQNYADGSWLAELAGLADPSLVPGAVAAAVGLRDVHARNLTSTLTDYLSQRQVLLLLDNCEHLVDACAELVAHLLRRCPRVHVLATSREPLSIAGETTWQVLPLEVPDLAQATSRDQLTKAAAVRLFLERASAVDNELVLSPRNAPAIARICVGVDGIPLAIELAAARTRMLTVEQLADRLDDDAGVLSGTNRAGLPQHRTMRATIDWSHNLLGEQEQILLRRLSLFAGGWTLESAEEVCSAAGIEPASVLDLLAQLVEKSMVLVDARHAAARYRLLEPVRQYALDRLEVSGEATSYRARHATAFLALAQSGPLQPAGLDEIPSLDRVEVEYANLRVALRWALNNQHTEAALRASSSLFRFWERRGHFQEGCDWLEQALALPGAADASASMRSGALNALAFLYWRGGDAERAAPVAEQALMVGRGVADPRIVAQALLNLGMSAYLRHEYQLAVAQLEESVALAREATRVPLLSVALTFLGRTLLWVNGPLHPRAAEVLEESLELAEAAHSRYATGHALATLGDLLWGRGEAARAVDLWRKALLVVSELADRRGIAGCIERLALVLAESDRLASAAWLFGAADAQHKALGIPLHNNEQVNHAHFVVVTREQMGKGLEGAWSAGEAASVEESVRRALDFVGPAYRASHRRQD